MSYRKISTGTPSATFSPASADGATPCGSQDGPATGPSGRGAAPVNLSPRQAKVWARRILGTCGLPGFG